MNRRHFLAAAGALLFLARERRAHAAVVVPANLQAQLIVKVSAFDRNFGARAGDTALVYVVQQAGDAESERLAAAVVTTLGGLGDIAGKPKRIESIAYEGPGRLADRCRTSRPAVVYFSSALEGDMASIASALSGVDVLTFGATAAHAERGAVVGFDLEEGKPKLVVNVTRAKAQNVSFKAGLLNLARIVG
jgi:hypothetical protein